ncbi:MFS transporter [Paenibacillus sp. 481]|nr:MFS transporter [Paenibacillus sp. 481]
MTLGNSMLIPVLPEIRRQLKVSDFQSSMLITVYSVMAILLIPAAGYLSDRLGRKVVIIPSLIIAGIGGAVCGAAAVWLDNSYSVILGGRVLQGIGAAGAMPIVLPLVGDMFKSEEDVSAGLGIVETANTFGKVLSPILGSALVLIAWYVPFWTIPVMCLISIVLVICLVKQPKKTEKKPQPLRQFLHSTWQLLKQNGRWLSALFAIGGMAMFVLFGLLFYLSETLEETHHYKGIVKGCILAIPLAVLCTASYITGKCIGEKKPLMKWIMVSGCFLAASAIVGCLFSRSVVSLIAWMSVAGLGLGASLPCLDSFITEGIEKEQRGTISSLYSSMRFAGVAAGPPVASLLMSPSNKPLFYTMAAVSATACALALFAIRTSRSTEQ